MNKRMVALVGTGGIAQAHIRGWLAHADAELALLCDVRAEAAEETRARHGLDGARAVTRLEDVLASDCELVDICTPSALHAAQVIACLEAGKHVLCEKPMADTLAEAEGIAAACRAHPDRVYLCEHRYLFEPLVIAAREVVSELGPLHWFRQRSAHALPLAPGIQATGAFLDIGYHPLYTALHFMGPATTAFGLRQRFARPDCADDTGLIVLEHERGGSIVEGSFSAAGPMGGTRPLEIYGERGTLIGNWQPKPQLRFFPGAQGAGRPEPGVEVPIPNGAWPVNATRHFLDCVAGTTLPLAGWPQALATMRAYDAALRSTQSGQKVPVQL
ncbi:MAG: Gfo/Idh/MocA family oxidoreductase [Chloroflexi bacterium]|nr:Gfo/Idh/MocA family oxidoreductase [Chloroflexota bacterium]